MSGLPTPARAEFTFEREQLVGMQRRTAVRYRCALATVGRLELADGGILETWILNLSETGIGLNLPHPLEAGTPVVIHLRGPAAGATVALAARVVHATPEPDASFRIGCAFVERLKPDALAALL
jgi:hypothetical protein